MALSAHLKDYRPIDRANSEASGGGRFNIKRCLSRAGRGVRDTSLRNTVGLATRLSAGAVTSAVAFMP